MRFLFLSSLVLISGCSMFGGSPAVPVVAPIEIVTVTVPAPMYHPPLPEAVMPAEVRWVVLNPSVMRAYIENYDVGDAPAVAYYGLTNQAYENLANNLADIRRYISQLLNINRNYRENDPTRSTEAEESVY